MHDTNMTGNLSHEVRFLRWGLLNSGASWSPLWEKNGPAGSSGDFLFES